MAVEVALGRSGIAGTTGAPREAERALAPDARIDAADADALRAMANGDGSAIADLFGRHWDAVARAAFRIAWDEDAARDAAQEAFIRLHLQPPAFDMPVRAWLCRVACNQAAIDARSGRRRAAREARHATAGTPDADAIAEANLGAERALVRETLAGLTERARTMLVLRAEGFRYHEIAATLGVSPGSVGTLLVRAERAFREGYEARRGGA